MAIMKSGAAYLPLDPDHPRERLAFIIDDAQPVICVTDEFGLPSLPAAVPTLFMRSPHSSGEQANWRVAELTTIKSREAPSLQNPAYVIYTSGSSGQPKGAVITQHGLLNHISWIIRTFRLGPGDRTLQRTSHMFDASVAEYLAPLLSGGSIVMLPRDAGQNPLVMTDLIASRRVSVLQVSPSLLDLLIAEGNLNKCEALRLIFSGGEPLLRHTYELASMQLRAEITNCYGPTETTVEATFCIVSAELIESERVPIGRPISNARVYVLNPDLEPVPIGVPGELYISGLGLARGYLRQPALTAERFVSDPYGPAGSRMYRTGDIVSWRHDQNLEFLMRADEQIKIRGFRVEPREVEAALLKCPGVRNVVVIAHEYGPGDERLIAYVVPTSGSNVNKSVINAELRNHLPEYMIPAAILTIKSIPLTTNGKLDKRELPVPEFTASIEYHSPRTPVEEILCSVFAEVLSIKRVGIDESIFALGGHSLLTMRLASRIREILLKEVTVRKLFELQTVRKVSEWLQGARATDLALERGHRPSFYVRLMVNRDCGLSIVLKVGRA